MRILHLIKHCEPSNGHVNVAVDLACLHVRAGHEVTFASAGGAYVDFLTANGIAHRRISSGWSPLSVAGAIADLVALCHAFRPDVIHAHMMSSAVLGFVASRLCRLPLVTTVHNSFDQHSDLMRLGDAVVAVSEAERRLLLSRGYSDRKLVTIYNGPVGSPREELIERKPRPVLATPCVITVAGLHARKGVHHLIAAFAATAVAYPEWHLNIIGEGPDRAKLETEVASLGLGARVHFVGAVMNPKPWLEQAQIFALASLAEPFGLVLVEARAAGCAVVATDVGGIPEVLAFGQAGHLVKAGDPEAMAQVFRELMGNPDQLCEWRRRSRKNVEAFAAGTTAGKYLALYQDLQTG